MEKSINIVVRYEVYLLKLRWYFAKAVQSQNNIGKRYSFDEQKILYPGEFL